MVHFEPRILHNIYIEIVCIFTENVSHVQHFIALKYTGGVIPKSYILNCEYLTHSIVLQVGALYFCCFCVGCVGFEVLANYISIIIKRMFQKEGDACVK